MVLLQCGCLDICCIDSGTSPMIIPWYSGNERVTGSRPSFWSVQPLNFHMAQSRESPKRTQDVTKRSLLLHTLYSIGITLSTVGNWLRFDSRGRGWSLLTWNQRWANSCSRGSHAPYLELRQCPAVPVKLRSRESNPRHAPSLLVITPRRWLFLFKPTVLGGFRTTRSRKNT